MRVKPKKALDIAAAVFLLLCFCASGYLACRCSFCLFDSDASSELALAKLLAEEGGILSTNWYYSTELRVLNTQLIYAPLFHFFSSWQIVRTLGSMLLQIILVLSFLFMTRQAGIRRCIRLFSAGLLLMPVSVTYARVVLFHCYYVPHIAIGFVLIGLLLGCLREEKKRSFRIVFFVLFLLLGFISGLGGIRQLMVTYAPLLVVFFLHFLRDVPRGTFGRLRRGELTGKAALHSLLHMPSFRPLFAAGVGTASCCAGYLANVCILARRYSFFDYSQTVLRPPTPAKLRTTVNIYLELFGFRDRVYPSLAFPEYLFAALGILVLLCSIVLGIIALRRRDRASGSLQLLSDIYPVGLILNACVLLLTNNRVAQYAVPATVFIIVLFAALLEQDAQKPRRFRSALVFCMIAVCLGNAAITNYCLVQGQCSTDDSAYSDIWLTGLRTDAGHIRFLRPAVDCLVQGGYTFGYATFWNSSCCSEASNGALRMVNLYDSDGILTCYHWLMPKNYPDLARAEEKVFLLLSRAEYTALSDQSWLKEAARLYENERFIAFSFPGDGALADLPVYSKY